MKPWLTSHTPRPRRPRPDDPNEGPIGRLVRFATRDVWMIEVGDLSLFLGFLTRVSRVVLITGRGFLRDRCMQQAAALTYLTIFTLPALLALAFSVAKGLGIFERLRKGVIKTFLDQAFPIDQGQEAVGIRSVVDRIFDYVQNTDFGGLGTVGVLFLVYAALKMLGSVERALNEIWGLQRSRTVVRKVTDYLAIVTVTPLALLVGTALTGVLASVGDFSPLASAAKEGAEVAVTEGADDALAEGAEVAVREGAEAVAKKGDEPAEAADEGTAIQALVSLAFICMGMTMVLLTLPNTRVRFLPALGGGMLAGIAWQLAMFGFVEFQMGASRVNAVFSSFAAVPLLLTWIYLSWLSVFAGAELSFAIQNERAVTGIHRSGVVDQRFREAAGIRLAARVAAAFLAGEPGPSTASLATDLGVMPHAIRDVLGSLLDHHILVETSGRRDEEILPARDPATITVVDVLDALRREEGSNRVPAESRMDARVDDILERFERTLRDSPENATLADLARTPEDVEARTEPRREGPARVEEPTS